MSRLAALGAVMLLLPAARAAAEWHLTPMTGVTFHSTTTLLDPEYGADKTHLQLGGAATLVGSGLFGVEAVAVFTPSFFRGDGQKGSALSPTPLPARVELRHGRTFALMGNAVLTLPKRWTEYSLRPFVSGGFGVMSSSLVDAKGVFPIKSDLPAYNIGGGAVGFLSERIGVRFDLRAYRSIHRPYQGPVSFGPVRINYLTASVGLVFRR